MNTKTHHVRIPVILLLVAVVLWTLWLIPDSSAQQGNLFNSPLPTPTATPSSKLAQDAKMYATEFDVDLNEAIRRLKLQGDIGDLNADLSEKEEKTFASLWIQHKPEYRVIVQFTQNGEAILQPYIKDGPLTDMIEVRMANVTLNQLRIDRERAAQIVNMLGIRAYTGINIIENRAELNVLDPVQLETALQDSGQQLPDNIKVIKVDEMPKEVTDIFGGLALTDCTSGFSVKTFDGSTKGITTAGHCSNTQTYDGKNLPFQSGTTGGVYDIQWHTAPDFTVRNLVYDGGAYNRYIYSVKFRNNQSVGDWVCKYGMTSSYSCGAIVDKDFDGVNIRVDTSVQPGDSGGPWFLGNIAYGTTISSVGDDSVYGPVDHIYNILGLTVMIESELHQSFWRGGEE